MDLLIQWDISYWKKGFKRIGWFLLIWAAIQSLSDLLVQVVSTGRITALNILFVPMLPFLYSSFLATVIATVLILRRERRPLSSLGLPLDARTGYYLGGGFLLGFLGERFVFSLHFFLLHRIWVFPWEAWPWNEAWNYLREALASSEFLLPIVYEELYHRGYLLQTLSVTIGSLPALLLNAFLWGSMHWYQGGLLPALNVSLLGVALGIAYLKTRGLWLPLGLHAGINLANVVPFANPYPDWPYQIWHGALSFTLFNTFLIVLCLLPGWKPHPSMRASWPSVLQKEGGSRTPVEGGEERV